MAGRSLAARGLPLAAPATQLDALRLMPLAREFDGALADAGLWPLCPVRLEIFQMNLGKVCNLTCRHCHVDAAPDREESMSRETMVECLAAIDRSGVRTVDLTGGAPELNPHFRWLLGELHRRELHVLDRCNLTILEQPAYRDLPDVFARHRVELVGSLPHYRQPSTDAQRGAGVFERSLAALRRLNAVGYGDGQSGLRLVLVTNPAGAFLPGGQASQEREWKREMLRLHGVRFDALYALTNMPVGRFLEWLQESGNAERYLERLAGAFNPAAAAGVMCRNTLSVAWDGRLYDCDFNQMLELPVEAPAPRHVRDLDVDALQARPIRVARHCFGCAAGAGSSCGGATA